MVMPVPVNRAEVALETLQAVVRLPDAFKSNSSSGYWPATESKPLLTRPRAVPVDFTDSVVVPNPSDRLAPETLTASPSKLRVVILPPLMVMLLSMAGDEITADVEVTLPTLTSPAPAARFSRPAVMLLVPGAVCVSGPLDVRDNWLKPVAVARLTLPKVRPEPAALKRNSSNRLALCTTSPMVIVLPSLTALTDKSCEVKVEVPATPIPAADADNLMPVTVFAAPAMVSAETKNRPPPLVTLMTPPVSTLTSRPESPMFRPADKVTALVAPATMSIGRAKLASPITPFVASLAVKVTVPPEEISAPALSRLVLMLPCVDVMLTLAVAPLAVTDWKAMSFCAKTDTVALELVVVIVPKDTAFLLEVKELAAREV